MLLILYWPMNKLTDKKALRNLASGLLDEGRVVRIEASGYSMYPTIKPGNIIHIEPVKSPKDLNPGDIIAWKREDDLVVHRLIGFDSSKGVSVITRGDSSGTPDRPVEFSIIAGKVVLIEKGNRKIIPVPQLFPNWRYRFNSRICWFIIRFRRIPAKVFGRGEK